MFQTQLKNNILTALFAALLAVCAIVAFPVPFSPVPVSLFTFGLFLTASLLPPKHAVSAAALHLLLGVIGLPVFSGFGSGIGVLFGPTGGYLWFGLPVAGIVSYLLHRAEHTVPQRIAVMLLGLVLCYLGGTVWYMLQCRVSFLYSLLVCVLPFVGADLAKIMAAAAATTVLRHALATHGFFR